jgi:hypothetical protein
MICPTGKVEYFFEKGWTAFFDLPVGLDSPALSQQLRSLSRLRAQPEVASLSVVPANAGTHNHSP